MYKQYSPIKGGQSYDYFFKATNLFTISFLVVNNRSRNSVGAFVII